MRPVVIFLAVVVVIFAIVRASSDRHDTLVANEAALNWTLRAAGGLMAAVAAFVLLWRSLASESLERQLGLVLPLLGACLSSAAIGESPLRSALWALL